MTSRFKKLAMASAVTIGLAGVALPASAAVLGGAGEALLIPLVVWSGGSFNDPDCDRAPFPPLLQCIQSGYTPAVDTLIEVWVPGSVGWDDIPNIFTAQHTTPTNGTAPLYPDTALTPPDPDLTNPATANISWFWFDQRSVIRDSGTADVSPNDVVQISWTQQAQGSHEDQPGYMVIVNTAARNGTDALFSMFGNAWITGAVHFDPPDARPFPSGIGFPLIGGSIPVLAMNDGADGPNVADNCAHPRLDDSVKYRGGIPCAVSPVVSGFRTNRSDDNGDLFAWDMTMSNRLLPTIHVVWVDQNLDDAAAINAKYPGNSAFPNPLATVDVYDLNEQSEDVTVNLPNELNVLWIPPAWETEPTILAFWNQPFQWTTDVAWMPAPTNQNPASVLTSGFAHYIIDEYIDTNVGVPESSAFAFAIKIDGGFVSNDPLIFPDAFVLMLETSLGHDLGTFNSF